MDLQLQGKKAVVTGGSRGIGLAVARQLAQEGCDVAICARNAGPLEAAARDLAAATGRQIFPFVCNTVDPESISQFIGGAAEKLAGIQILVNSAARPGGARGNMEIVDDTEILHDFEEKVVGYLRCARAAAPHMKQAGWGRIVNITGGAGRNPGTNVSGGVRNIGVVNLSKSMANYLGPHGINVMAVYPGMTVTEATYERWNEQAQRESTTVEALAAKEAEGTLLKHLVTAEEVANLVTFLCSPLSVGLTGEAIAINGGGSPDVHA